MSNAEYDETLKQMWSHYKRLASEGQATKPDELMAKQVAQMKYWEEIKKYIDEKGYKIDPPSWW